MNDLERLVLELYEEWATKGFQSDEMAAFTMIRIFEWMKDKYPDDMHEAFNRGFLVSRYRETNPPHSVTE
jgi:hypothetical protein